MPSVGGSWFQRSDVIHYEHTGGVSVNRNARDLKQLRDDIEQRLREVAGPLTQAIDGVRKNATALLDEAEGVKALVAQRFDVWGKLLGEHDQRLSSLEKQTAELEARHAALVKLEGRVADLETKRTETPL